MKTKELVTMFPCFFWLIARVHAQDADALVAQGRAFLAQKDLPNANARFSAAVTAWPDHETANALYAATRLLVLPNDPSVANFLDRLGISQTNRSINHWSTSVPRDTNGVPLAPPGMSGADASDLIHATILPEMDAAASNLAMVTSTNFLLNLSSNETSITDVTLDRGDILMLRSLLQFTE